MTDRKPVKLYMRVENQNEICVGTARTMTDVPVLLMGIAELLRMGLSPDEIEAMAEEAAPPPTPSSSS